MKLNKDEGYQLLLKLMTSWILVDHAIEDDSNIINSFMSGIGKDLYLESLKWNEGTSLMQREKWVKQRSVEGSLEDFDEEYNREFEYDTKALADIILDITSNIIKPFVDVEIKRREVYIERRVVQVDKKLWICPVCKNENDVHFSHGETTCRKCKIVVSLKDRKNVG